MAVVESLRLTTELPFICRIDRISWSVDGVAASTYCDRRIIAFHPNANAEDTEDSDDAAPRSKVEALNPSH